MLPYFQQLITCLDLQTTTTVKHNAAKNWQEDDEGGKYSTDSGLQKTVT